MKQRIDRDLENALNETANKEQDSNKKLRMKVWTNNQFEGHWPVPTAAVVIAPTAERAAEILNNHLIAMRLPGDAKVEDMQEVNTRKEYVVILSDGQY